MANDSKKNLSTEDNSQGQGSILGDRALTPERSDDSPKSGTKNREKMDIPQSPGGQIVIGPEGPYSEEVRPTTPAPDSDAR